MSHSINDIKNSTNSQLASLKEQWKDNVQKDFYDKKVSRLNDFLSSSSSQLSQISNNFNRLSSQIDSI